MTAVTGPAPVHPPAVRVERPTRCPVCGHDGFTLAYRDLQDRLFGAPGSWQFQRCGRCASLCLAPRPIEADLALVYTDSYSRRKPARAAAGPTAWRHRLSRYFTNGYLSATFGYHPEATSAQRVAGHVIKAMPRRREAIELHALGLPHVPGGRLLDIGCGVGDVLSEMTCLGWRAEGVDTDPDVVRQSRERGLVVHQGTLEGQAYPEGTFDAVSAKHVLEHVAEPVAFLAECRRVLKPGGRMVIFTPNVASAAHRLFGRHWLGLDAPRHLVLFTPASLELATRRAGLEIERLETTGRITGFNWRVSYEMAVRGRTAYVRRAFPESGLVERVSPLVLRPALLAGVDVGDELFIIARRT
jgi:2-polyprenyl-3-methyl-5-hydroxy-6-metoxy-1,4-benzoquinol methylase